jgi:hypothetical protein
VPNASDWGYIFSAIITGFFGLFIAWQNNRLHKEVKTNHGKRAGQRLEELGDDVAQIKRTMVTQQDLQEHSDHDVIVAAELAKNDRETRDIILAAIKVEK